MFIRLEKKFESEKNAIEAQAVAMMVAKWNAWKGDVVTDTEIITFTAIGGENQMSVSVDDDIVIVEYAGRRGAMHSNPVFANVLQFGLAAWDADHKPTENGWEVVSYDSTTTNLGWWETNSVGGGWTTRYCNRDRLGDIETSLEWQLQAVRREMSYRSKPLNADELEGVDPSDICELCGGIHLRDGCVDIPETH